MSSTRVIIMGAAGRDFHNFNICYRDNPAFRVVAFTAAQIPYIDARRYPPVLAGSLYPGGIPILLESELEKLIATHKVNQVVFSYSDISYQELMHRASRVVAMGADFLLLGPERTMIRSQLPVVSVCAVRTGCGKSQLTGYLVEMLQKRGISPVVVRHPMPYGVLEDEIVQQYVSKEDLFSQHCTLEEREEFEPLLERHVTVLAGVDYQLVLRAAEQCGQVIIWDGGNNDLPFFRPDLEITILDPLRPGDETGYYPGEVNLRRAHLLVINKADAAHAGAVAQVTEMAARINPFARIVTCNSKIYVSDPGAIAGKHVLVIEDGPTVTHGGLPSGAGLAAAHQYGASEIVDPRTYSRGSLATVYNEYPHLGPVLPAMGYRPEQLEDLRQTILATPCDLVLSATPVDLKELLALHQPVLRVTYRIEESGDNPIEHTVADFLSQRGL